MLQLMKPKKSIYAGTGKQFAQRIAEKYTGIALYENDNTALVLAHNAVSSYNNNDLEQILALLWSVLSLCQRKIQLSVSGISFNMLHTVKLYLQRLENNNANQAEFHQLTEIYNSLAEKVNRGTLNITVIEDAQIKLEQITESLRESKAKAPKHTMILKTHNSRPLSNMVMRTINRNTLRIIGRSTAFAPNKEKNFLKLLAKGAAVCVQNDDSKLRAEIFAGNLTTTQKQFLNDFVVTRNLFSQERAELGISSEQVDITVLLPYASQTARTDFFNKLQQYFKQIQLKEKQADKKFSFNNQAELEEFLINSSEESFSEYIKSLFEHNGVFAQEDTLFVSALRLFREKNIQSRNLRTMLDTQYSRNYKALQELLKSDESTTVSYFLNNMSGTLTEQYVDFLMLHELPAFDIQSSLSLIKEFEKAILSEETEWNPAKLKLTSKQTMGDRLTLLQSEYSNDTEKFLIQLLEYALHKSLSEAICRFGQSTEIIETIKESFSSAKDVLQKLFSYDDMQKTAEIFEKNSAKTEIFNLLKTEDIWERFSSFILLSDENEKALISSIIPSELEKILNFPPFAKEKLYDIKLNMTAKLEQLLPTILQKNIEKYSEQIYQMTMEFSRRNSHFTGISQNTLTQLRNIFVNEIVHHTDIASAEKINENISFAVMLERAFGLKQFQDILVSYEFSDDKFYKQMQKHIAETDITVKLAFAEYIISSVQNDTAESYISRSDSLTLFAEQLEQILYADGAYENSATENLISECFDSFFKEGNSLTLREIYSEFFGETANGRASTVKAFLQSVDKYNIQLQRDILQLFSKEYSVVSECYKETEQLFAHHNEEIAQLIHNTETGFQISSLNLQTAFENVSYNTVLNNSLREIFYGTVSETISKSLKNIYEENSSFRRGIISYTIWEQILSQLESETTKEIQFAEMTDSDYETLIEQCELVTLIKSTAKDNESIKEYYEVLHKISNLLQKNITVKKSVSYLRDTLSLEISEILHNSSLLENAAQIKSSQQNSLTAQIYEEIDRKTEMVAENIIQRLQAKEMFISYPLQKVVGSTEYLLESSKAIKNTTNLSVQRLITELENETKQTLQNIVIQLLPQTKEIITNITEENIKNITSAENFILWLMQDELKTNSQDMFLQYDTKFVEQNSEFFTALKQFAVANNESLEYENLIKQYSTAVEKLQKAYGAEQTIENSLQTNISQFSSETEKYFNENELLHKFIAYTFENPTEQQWLKELISKNTAKLVYNQLSREIAGESENTSELQQIIYLYFSNNKEKFINQVITEFESETQQTLQDIIIKILPQTAGTITNITKENLTSITSVESFILRLMQDELKTNSQDMFLQYDTKFVEQNSEFFTALKQFAVANNESLEYENLIKQYSTAVEKLQKAYEAEQSTESSSQTNISQFYSETEKYFNENELFHKFVAYTFENPTEQQWLKELISKNTDKLVYNQLNREILGESKSTSELKQTIDLYFSNNKEKFANQVITEFESKTQQTLQDIIIKLLPQTTDIITNITKENLTSITSAENFILRLMQDELKTNSQDMFFQFDTKLIEQNSEFFNALKRFALVNNESLEYENLIQQYSTAVEKLQKTYGAEQTTEISQKDISKFYNEAEKYFNDNELFHKFVTYTFENPTEQQWLKDLISKNTAKLVYNQFSKKILGESENTSELQQTIDLYFSQNQEEFAHQIEQLVQKEVNIEFTKKPMSLWEQLLNIVKKSLSGFDIEQNLNFYDIHSDYKKYPQLLKAVDFFTQIESIIEQHNIFRTQLSAQYDAMKYYEEMLNTQYSDEKNSTLQIFTENTTLELLHQFSIENHREEEYSNLLKQLSAQRIYLSDDKLMSQVQNSTSLNEMYQKEDTFISNSSYTKEVLPESHNSFIYQTTAQQTAERNMVRQLSQIFSESQLYNSFLKEQENYSMDYPLNQIFKRKFIQQDNIAEKIRTYIITSKLNNENLTKLAERFIQRELYDRTEIDTSNHLMTEYEKNSVAVLLRNFESNAFYKSKESEKNDFWYGAGSMAVHINNNSAFVSELTQKQKLTAKPQLSFIQLQNRYALHSLPEENYEVGTGINMQYADSYFEKTPSAEQLHYASPATAESRYESKQTVQTEQIQRQLETMQKKIDGIDYENKKLQQNMLQKADRAVIEQELIKKIEDDIYLAGKRHGMIT